MAAEQENEKGKQGKKDKDNQRTVLFRIFSPDFTHIPDYSTSLLPNQNVSCRSVFFYQWSSCIRGQRVYYIACPPIVH